MILKMEMYLYDECFSHFRQVVRLVNEDAVGRRNARKSVIEAFCNISIDHIKWTLRLPFPPPSTFFKNKFLFF